MNWKNVILVLLGLSLGLNLAFVGIWVYISLGHGHYAWMEQGGMKGSVTEEHHAQDKNLAHRFFREQLDGSEAQWQKIMPNVKQFHRTSYEICQQIGELRNKVLEEIEKDSPNPERLKTLKNNILKLRARKQEASLDFFQTQKKHLNDSQQDTFFKTLRRKPHCERHRHHFKPGNPSPGAPHENHEGSHP